MDSILLNFNWIDLLVICIIARVVYIGLNSSFVTEVFKLLGSFVATVIVLHYYVIFALFLQEKFMFPEPISQQFSFILAWLTVYVVFKMIISGWGYILKEERHPIVDKWGGFLCSLGRTVFILGIFFTLLLVSGNSTVKKFAKQSFSGYYLLDFAPTVYQKSYDGFIGKFFPGEKLNLVVFDLKKEDKEDEEGEEETQL